MMAEFKGCALYNAEIYGGYHDLEKNTKRCAGATQC